MKKIELKRPEVRRGQWMRRSREFLKKIQEELMPEHADEVVAINMESGEYVLGKTNSEATEAFWDRWPDVMMFVCRVDGGPVTKFHGI